MNNTKIQLIESILKQAKELPHRDSGELDALIKRSDMIIGKVFGDSSEYKNTLNNISFRPGVYFSGMADSNYDGSWNSGCSELINLVETMLEDLQLSSDLDSSPTETQILSDEIFIVHGHNEEMKQSVARTIETLELKPIILHEQPNKGRTIIEKFENYSQVSFAIILLSADDVAFEKESTIEQAKLRARQNVILELGFFIGKLGRERVLALFEDGVDIEIPSDYKGVLYVAYDKAGKWKFELIKELKASGMSIDANKII